MRTMFRKRAAFGAAAMLLAGAAQAVPGQGTWESTLKGRDIDGNPVNQLSSSAVFLYDTDLDVTWLRDANKNGDMTWDTAKSWAFNLVVGGYDDWRLPSTPTIDGWACQGDYCTESEMGHLYYRTLGNVPFSEAGPNPDLKTGSFQNLRSWAYWSEENFVLNPLYAWGFNFNSGYQDFYAKKITPWRAMAVRPGDVTAVPEPQTYAILLLGLGVVIVAVWRRPR